MKESSEISNSPDRKIYCSPSFIEMGSISEITKGGGSETVDNTTEPYTFEGSVT